MLDLDYRIAARSDGPALSELGRRCWGYVPPAAYWAWKYFDNPFGPSGLGIAAQGDAVVGVAGAVALPFHTARGPATGYLVGDNEVLPEHRAGGTVLRLSGALLAQGRADTAVEFRFGSATRAAQSVSVMLLGFETAFPVRKLVKVINPGAYLRQRLRLSAADFLWRGRRRRLVAGGRALLESGRVPVARVFDARFDQLWEACVKAPIMVRRDRAYLDWRYARCPGVDYRTRVLDAANGLEGYVVFHLVGRRAFRYGVIDDLLVRDPAAVASAALLRVALAELAGLGADAVLAWVSGPPPLAAAFRARGFLATRTPYTFIVSADTPRFAGGFLQAEANWYHTVGDHVSWLYSEDADVPPGPPPIR